MRVVKVHKNEIAAENTFNRKHIGIEDNHESSNDEKILF